MSNYLISLRNKKDDGTPGAKLGDTTYVSFADDATDYLLNGDDVVADGTTWADLVKEAAGGGPVIVFVHGYNNSSSHVVTTQLSLKTQLAASTAFGEAPFCLVSFDWPTDHWGVTYKKDCENAQQSAPRLQPDCLALLVNAVGSKNVHLFGHSMGSYVTQLAFQDTVQWAISHVMLAAADVAASDFETNNSQLIAFLKHCGDFTCYWSADDKALDDSQKIHHNKERLGRVGLTAETTAAEEQCVNVNSTTYYETYIQPTDPGAETSHIWYLSCGDLIEDLSKVVSGASSLPNREPDPSGNKDWYDLIKADVAVSY